MASRRMFSLRVINTARFLKMPTSTQCLYFHLGLHADDDGIVEAYPVLSSIGATEDDLKILVAKNFVNVLNEDLVTYITDWTENNKIRADRKIDSIYKDLLLQVLPEAELLEKKPRADRLPKSADVHGTSQGQPMDGIGKDRLGKGSIGKDNIPTKEECVNEYVSEKLSSMSKLYQKNIGMANGIVGEWLIDMSNQIDIDLFKKALEICTEKGKLNFGYLKGIIKNWLDINITSLEQLQAYELQNNKTSNNSITSKQKNIPATQKQCDDAEFKRRLEESNKLLDSLDENIWGD
jgi:DnaD/phage-associated family protein